MNMASIRLAFRGACVPSVGAFSLVLVLLISPQVLGAGRVFTDGFEDGTTNKWTKNGQRDMCPVVTKSLVDGVPPHSGLYMLECNWNGVVPWNDPAAFSVVMLPTWPYTSEFLVRVWVRFESDVTAHDGSKILRLYPADAASDELAIQPSMASPAKVVQFGWVLNGKQYSFWGNGPYTIGFGICQIFYIYLYQRDPGAENGTTRVWMDGVLLQELKGIVTMKAGGRWSGLYIMSNWSNNPGWEHGANNHVNWDDIEIYSDAGTGGVGKMSDASITATGSVAAAAPPSPPKPPSSVVIK